MFLITTSNTYAISLYLEPMYEWWGIKISLLLYLSHRSTALIPSPSACMNAEIVPSLLFPGNLRRDTYGKQDTGQAAMWESGSPWALGQWPQHCRLCEEPCQERQDSRCGCCGCCSHPGTYLHLNGTVPRLRMTRSWARNQCKPLPPLGMRCSQYTCLQVVLVGNLGVCSFCVSICQG